MIKIKWRFIQFFSYFAKSWPRNGAYVSYFWQIGLTFFMEAQETIIYYLSIGDEKSKLWRLFFIFGSLFAGKWAWPPRVPIMVWDLQTWPKSCHFWRTFSANRYPQNMFSKFSVVNHVLDQKVGFLGEPFGPIAISKSCFRNFQGSTPIPLPPVSTNNTLVQGYDVWLGNVRGNIYSLNHTTLTPDSHQFWDFSFQEMAEIDLPAMVDKVLEVCASFFFVTLSIDMVD